jgi:hypothetical protein
MAVISRTLDFGNIRTTYTIAYMPSQNPTKRISLRTLRWDRQTSHETTEQR